MRKFKNIYPYVFCFVSIIFSYLIWDFLKLPYDENNIIQGTAFNKKINPYDNTLKVLFFIFFPLLIFFIFFIKEKNLLSINPLKKNFFLKDNGIRYKNLNDTNSYNLKLLNFLTILILIFCILSFFSLDFKKLLQPVDIYHDGLILVPPFNFDTYEKFWLSIHFDYGIGGNLRPKFIWKMLGLESIGSARFLDQCFILLNKILIILICRKVTLIVCEKKNISIIFFIFLTLSSIQLTDYFVSLTGTGGSEFPLRLFLFLLFYLFLLENIFSKNNFTKAFILGSFSSTSFLWFTDIAFYLNGVLVAYLLILTLSKNQHKIYIIISGILFSWILFVLFFGLEETSQMFFQIRSNLKFIYYFNFLEFPKPFSEDYASSRAVKSLILIIINGLICINLCLKKSFKLNLNFKVLLLITFVCSIIIFKSALVRADSYHLKYTLGFILFLFFVQIYYLVFINQNYFFKNIYLLRFKKLKLATIYSLFSLVLFLITNNLSFDRISNNIKNDIKTVLIKEDNYFLKFKIGMYNYGRKFNSKNLEDDQKFINYYTGLTKNDNCVQNFTEYLALAYFLKKPTCTSFYNAQFIQHKITDEKFIREFKDNMPNYILYKSPISFFDKSGYKQQNNLMNGIPNVEKFIKKNYSFYTSYLNNWVIYKKINKQD